MDSKRAANLANIGTFILTLVIAVLTVALLVFAVWVRWYPDPAKAPTPQVEALMSGYGWGPPIFLGVCLLFLGVCLLLQVWLIFRRKKEKPTTPSKDQLDAREADLQQKFDALQSKYDDTAWLREGADIQAPYVAPFIKTECWILEPDLSRESSLFIEFGLRFTSYCMSTLSFEKTDGFIRFSGQRFSNSPTLVKNEFKNVHMGSVGFLTIRQQLTTEERAFTLNRSSQFTFDDLHVELRVSQGKDGPGKTESVRLGGCAGVDNTKLLEQSPKLIMEAKGIKLQGFIDYDMESKGWDKTKLASTFNVNLQLENPRRIPVEIQRFKLLTITDGKERHTPAQVGQICDNPRLKNDEIVQAGNSLSNLNRCPISAEFGDPLDGWLQFIVRDLSTRYLHGKEVTIIAVDSRGEEHPLSIVAPTDRPR